jgi:uncharacterized delta-60 repeat protein
MSADSYRREKWRWGLSGLLLLLLAGWGVLPGQVWSQPQKAGAVAFQQDGKIVTVATEGFAVARYYPDGRLDPSFGTDGKVVTRLGTAERIGDASVLNDSAGFVVVQRDGHIVAAGGSNNSFAAVRYHSDGSLDTSFGQEGKVTTRIGTDPEIEDALHDMALQSDGKIVVVGRVWKWHSNDFAVVRYNSDGTLDASFGTEGIVTTDFTPAGTLPALGSSGDRPPEGKRGGMRSDTARPRSLGPSYDDAFALAIQADGKLMVGGTCLVRYNPDGSLDSSFGSGGRVRTEVHALVLQRDGKIVTVGAAGAFALARYNSDGSLDTNFGSGGTVTTQLGRVDAAGSVALQADDKLIVVGKSFNGHSINFAMVRYTPEGRLDASFGTGGKVTSDFCANQIEEHYAQHVGTGSISGGWRVRLQADDKIIVMGAPSNSLCSGSVIFRYNADGSLDPTFGENGRVTTASRNEGTLPNPALQRDGKIVLAGTSGKGFAAARYTPAGSLDSSFGTGGKVTTRIGAGHTEQ